MESPEINQISFIENQGNRVKPLAELISRILTVLTGLSVMLTLLGAILLITYVRDVGAPMPAIDGSLSIFFVSFSVILLAFFVLGASVILVPFLAKYMDPQVAEIYPGLFDRLPRRDWRAYLKDYSLYFSPFLALLIGTIAISYLRTNVSTSEWMVLLFFLLGFLLQILYICRHARDPDFHVTKFFGPHAKVLFSSYCASTASLLLLIPLLLILSVWLDNNMLQHPNWATFTLLISVIIFILVHAAVAWGFSIINIKAGITRVLFLSVAVIIVWPGFPFLVGRTLRFVGQGGGLPVKLKIKVPEEGNKEDTVTGRLILSTGSQVLSVKLMINIARQSRSLLFFGTYKILLPNKLTIGSQPMNVQMSYG
jgi:hypothetical protein